MRTLRTLRRPASIAFRPALLLLLALAVVGLGLAGALLTAGPETPPAYADLGAGTNDVTAVSITSSPASGDNYRTGETITITLTFTKTVQSLGIGNPFTPALAVQIGGNSRSLSATLPNPRSTTVNFNYTVVAADYDADGITVARNALSGNLSHIHPGGDTVTPHSVPYSGNSLPNTLVAAQSGHQVNSHLTSYDTDGDNLIEISTLAQLNAIRYDADGNGAVNAGDQTNYNTAFPTAAPGMGCAAACAGYELFADLDFDTTGDDDVADAPYANWTPLPEYSATFDGNGRTISNLAISNSTSNTSVGLFARLNGSSAVIRYLGLINPAVTGSAADQSVGALVANQRGGSKIYAVYTSGGSVTANGQDSWVGGLVGFMSSSNTSIRASYNRGTTVRGGGWDVLAGGLAGTLHSGPNITASYAAASVTNAHTTGVFNSRSAGGVTGWFGTGNSVTNSYWDTIVGPTHSGGGAGRTTTQLQTPQAYGTGSTDIYRNWNVNVDGAGGNDDPWDFGTASQYPILQFGHDAVSVSRQRGGTASVDYDANDNNLIDIAALAQLDAIRWDLDGDGNSVTGANALKYAAAFPNLMAGMGCPAGCAGYELTAHLDLDTDDDGSTHTSGTSDGDDDYHNGGAGWQPIGARNTTPYNAVFDGQGYVIRNLFIQRGDFTGLFGAAGTDAVIRGVGLPDAYIDGVNGASVGALVGANAGTVSASWSSGSVESKQIVGGLVGRNGDAVTATVTNSYSTATVTADGGTTFGNAGGLVGYNFGIISNSYAAGAVSVTGTNMPGGLVGGQETTGASITASYFDSGATTGSNSNGTAQTATQLQEPLAPPATGTYAGWDTAVWDFGTASQYPVLKYGSYPYSAIVQRGGGDYTRGNTLIDVSTLAQLNAIRWDPDGNGTVSAANVDSYQAAFPGFLGCQPACTGYELTADLDFDTTGDDDVADLPYANWTPIPQYSGVFDGNGYTISNLNISRSQSTNDWIGLFSGLNGSSAVIRSVGLLNPTVTVANTGGNAWAGTLVGQNHARIEASYVRDGSVTVTADALGALVGGLVGRHSDGVIIASYAVSTPVSINAGTTGFYRAGGLTGGNYGNASINASYAASTVTNSATGGTRSTGGLTGAGSASSVVNSYWDATVETTAAGRGTGRTTTQLQELTGYTGIYANWNVNADGDTSTGAMTTGADDPWNFGSSSEYPVLQLGYGVASIARQWTATTDYDANDNNLIEVATLAQLDAVRYDLDGDGDTAAGADTTAYLKAFPTLAPGMGCPDGCDGYELAAHLDFDTTGDDDVADAPYANWVPIGDNTTPYAADFNGQGYTISNLRSRRVNYVGLFGVTGPNSDLTGVGLPNVDLVSGSGASVGALAGVSRGTVTASWSTGSVTARHTVGGLLGRNGNDTNDTTSTVANSYSTATVSSTQSNAGNAGGLVGLNHGAISNSYAVGAVSITGTATPGGLAGDSLTGASITASYYDSTVQTTSNSHGTGQTTSQLQTPTTPPSTGTYAGWDTAVWDFGTASDYPILKYGGNLYGQAVQRTVDYSGDNNLIDVDSLAKLNAIRWDLDGNGVVAAANLDNYLAAFPGLLGCDPACTGYELTADLDFDTNDSGATHTGGVGDAGDAWYNGGAGWTPIGHWTTANDPDFPYAGVFDGNNHTIANLFISSSTSTANGGNAVALFGATTGVLRDLVLLNPYVSVARTGGNVSYPNNEGRAAALVGRVNGGVSNIAVSNVEVRGGSVTYDQSGSATYGSVGCLVAEHDTTADIIDSGASCTVTVSASTGSGGYTASGGLVGYVLVGTDITRSHATGAVSVAGSDNHDAGGLAGRTPTSAFITSSYATGNVVSTGTTTNGSAAVGGLIGESVNSDIKASWASGNVTAAAVRKVGGLVGKGELQANDVIQASYATGAVSRSSTDGTDTFVGGLIGQLKANDNNSITATYATGAVSKTAAAGSIGGLVGGLDSSGAAATPVAYSYWTNAQTASGGTTGATDYSAQTAATLQSRTGYANEFANWNQNLDGQAGNDDPWDFGTESQYPVLKYDHDVLSLSRQRGGTGAQDYDANDNNLIDIGSGAAGLAQLNAIRYDTDGDGDGIAAGSAAAAYAAAFPNLMAGMGCPDGCTGYELTAHLNFDTDNDNVADAPYANWTPISDYAAIFDGQGYTVSNLNVSNAVGGQWIGLFAGLSGSGTVVRSFGLINPTVRSTGSGTAVNIGIMTGKLDSNARFDAVYVRGGSIAVANDDSYVGGLVGFMDGGHIRASYNLGAAVSVTGNNTHAGGLVGQMGSGAGVTPSITASYVAARVTNSQTTTVSAVESAGGVLGDPTAANVNNSYWVTGDGFPTHSGGGTGYAASDLQTPTEYGASGSIYFYWNLDLDGVTGTDDPWDFGTASEYPILKYGGHSTQNTAWRGRAGYAITQNSAAVTAPLTVTEADANGSSYGIALSVQPDAAVTVTIASPATDDVTIDTGDGTFSDSETLTFTTANWNTPQTLTLKAAGDANIGDDETTLTLTGGNASASAASGYLAIRRSVEVTATDSSTVSIIVSTTATGNAISALNLNEIDAVSSSNNQDYYVRLSNQPDAAVTVTISSDNDAVQIHDEGVDYTASDFTRTRTLTFTTTGATAWNVGQEVTVRGMDDGNSDHETVTITHTGSPSGSGYNNVVASLTVNVTDNDTPSIALASADNFVVTEGTDASPAYTVRLNSAPAAGNTVTVTLTATGAMIDTDGDSTYSASETLTFTDTTYNTAQNVAIRTADDDDLEDGSASIMHRSSGDSNYNGLTATANITITNSEDGEINITAAQTPLEVDEGSTATYTVALGKRPKAAATVDITIGGNTAGVTVNPTALDFTRSNWNRTQTVTVTAPNDSNLSPDDATLTHTGSDAVSGTASGYGAPDPVTAALAVTVADTTDASITLSTTTISIPEEGDDVTYTVRLSDEPSANVTVTIASDNAAIILDTDGDGTFTASETLDFTASNYSTTQDVVVRAPHDTNPTHERVTLTHTGSDPGTASGYADVTASITVNVRDNDTPGIRLSSEMLNVDEAGTATNLYTVRLNTLPANNADVTVTFTATGVTVDADGDGTYSASETLTFTAGMGPLNWETAQNISVRGPANNNDLAGTTGSIVHRAASADNDYRGKIATAAVAIANTETGSLALTAPADFAVLEGGTAAYTVKLDKRPLENVSVAISSTNSSVTLSPPPLTFTRSNWNRAQTVTLTAAADSDLTDGSTTLDHAASNAGSETSGYAGVIATLTVPVHDTTSPDITLSPTALNLNEGDPGSYTVVLDNPPAAEVTVAVVSSDPGRVQVSPSSLTFTTGNSANPQTVNVTTTADGDNYNDAVAIAHTPTIRGVANPATTLSARSNRLTPADPDAPAPRTRFTPSDAGGSSAYTVDAQAVTVTSDAGIPAGVSIATVDALTADLTLTLETPAENVPARGGGFRLNAGSIVDITVTPAVPSAGLEICLPKGRDDIMMLRYTDSGGWVEVPGSRVSGDRICATIADFSVFGVGRRAGAELLETAIEFGEGRYAEITVQVQDTTTESVRVTWVVGAAISGASASANDFANSDHTAPLTSFPSGSITVPPGADATAVIRIPIYDDNDAEGPERFTVRITQASGGIADHNDLPIEAVIALSDPTLSLRAPEGTGTGGADDTANAPLTAASTLVITEGATHAYTIALSARPDGDVTVVIHSNHDGVTTNPPSVDFTRANWQQPQRVTVNIAKDGDDKHDQATLTHILTDADGDLIEIIDQLKLFVVDTDPPDGDDIC